MAESQSPTTAETVVDTVTESEPPTMADTTTPRSPAPSSSDVDVRSLSPSDVGDDDDDDDSPTADAIPTFAPSSSPSGFPTTIASATQCSIHPECATQNLTGECCPTTDNVTLLCCVTSGSAPGTTATGAIRFSVIVLSIAYFAMP
jgi:hypothetical protein